VVGEHAEQVAVVDRLGPAFDQLADLLFVVVYATNGNGGEWRP
jgi:hypothetical protein